jgi:HAD superfamily hydrolase (TIGR01549 family)
MSAQSAAQPLATFITHHHKTHIIFDFDATLVYMHIPWHLWGKSLRDEFIALDAELWEDLMAKRPGINYQNELVERHGDRAVELLRRHDAQFEMQHGGKFTPNEALLQEVSLFRHTYSMFIWSSNSRQLVDSVLAQTSMNHWFAKIVTRDDVHFLKPSPEGFGLIRDPSVSKDRYLLVGDSSHDRGAAEAAGIDFYHTDFFNIGR